MGVAEMGLSCRISSMEEVFEATNGKNATSNSRAASRIPSMLLNHGEFFASFGRSYSGVEERAVRSGGHSRAQRAAVPSLRASAHRIHFFSYQDTPTSQSIVLNS